MATTAQQQAAPSCPCQHHQGPALVRLVVAFAIVVTLNRLGGWRRKRNDKKPDGTAGGGAGDGGKA